MTTGTAGPLSRPLAVDRLPPEGTPVVVEATAEERAALARDFDLVAIDSLVGRFHLSGSAHRVVATGLVAADVVQTCVVTLEPFPSRVEEEVEVEFSEGEASRRADAEDAQDAEGPDPIVDGTIDLGSLTAEFLALGLDPYPRKPGAEFAEGQEPADRQSPFAALKTLGDGTS